MIKRKTEVANNNSGFTLLELTISIFISGVVVILLFSAYISISKGAALQSRRAERVREMIYSRDRLSNIFDSVTRIVSSSTNELQCAIASDTLIHTLRYKNRSILFDSKSIIPNVTKFTLKTDSKQQERGTKSIVTWECTLHKGGWIGGAFVLDQ